MTLLALSGAATSAHARVATGAGTYNYFGDTSQKNQSGIAANIRIDLQDATGVNSYSLVAEWGVLWQGGAACSVFDHETRVTMQHVKITGSGFTLSHLAASPGPDHTASLTAHFTKGRVSGRFTDTVSNGKLTCTSGNVSYSANRIG